MPGPTGEGRNTVSGSMTDAMPTTCLNCRSTAVLTIAEALAWEAEHGPGKCEPPDDELCGLDACELAGFCQARSGCERLSQGKRDD